MTKSFNRYRFCVCFVHLPLLIVSLSVQILAQDSKPGLVATYADEDRSVVNVVPTPNFRLTASQSIHPQIGQPFKAEWSGLLRIDRAGQYRVYANGAVVEVAGKNDGQPVTLSTGEHPIRIQFKRDANRDARLQLRWQSEFFRDEPVPSSVLRHAKEPVKAQQQQSVERGRFLFAELGCANCHAASNWNLQSRRGPDLTNAGSRIDAGWLFAWLKNPHEYRQAAVMPVCLDTDQERADVTAFVMSLKSSSPNQESAVATPAQIEHGRELFEKVGCAKCHDKKNNLDAVGSKYVAHDVLAKFISNPHSTDSGGRMPKIFNPTTEQHLVADVARFLFTTKTRKKPYAAPPLGNATRGAKLFSSHGCASCHSAASPLLKKDQLLTGPDFGQQKGLALRHYWDFGSLGTSSPVKDRITGNDEQTKGQAKIIRSDDDRERSFEFNGNTFIELNHFHRPDTMTISAWVKTTHGGSILTWGRPGGGKRGSRELRMNIGQDGKNSLCYGEYNSDGGWRPVIVRPKDVNMVDGNWHHIAMVRKKQSIQHFVDGQLKGSGQTHKAGGDYTDRLLIGALGLQSNPSNRFKGQMDDLSIWEMALSPEQIKALASGKSPLEMARPEKRELKPFNVARGCLADDVKRPLPVYQLNNTDRTALRSFLETVHPDAKTPYHEAPLTTLDLRIQQFRCTACHELHDQNVQKAVAVDEEGSIVRVERPPLLTGAGAKLTESWLREVLLQKQRNRPWLNLRMPHFGAGVHELPALISSSAGISEREVGPEPDRSLATAGLEMIGVRRGKVACITCHDYRGINRRKDGVVPAPDLADAGQTVRREWFERWMHNPQRLQPGTSMPQLFLNVSPEERKLRIARLWSALYYQKQLPLPKGVLEQKTEGTRIVVKDKPVLFRMATVTPVGRIDRAINVGIPGGLNFAFDAVSCRLRYVWKGPFIDAGPAWNGRGGNPVKAGNDGLVAIKSAHAVRIGSAAEPQSLRFRGYRLVSGLPVFRYEVDGAAIEHHVTLTESHVIQKIKVRGAKSDVLYVGDSDTAFVCKNGQRDGNVVRFAKSDVVEFEIVMVTDQVIGK